MLINYQIVYLEVCTPLFWELYPIPSRFSRINYKATLYTLSVATRNESLGFILSTDMARHSVCQPRLFFFLASPEETKPKWTC